MQNYRESNISVEDGISASLQQVSPLKNGIFDKFPTLSRRMGRSGILILQAGCNRGMYCVYPWLVDSGDFLIHLKCFHSSGTAGTTPLS